MIRTRKHHSYMRRHRNLGNGNLRSYRLHAHSMRHWRSLARQTHRSIQALPQAAPKTRTVSWHTPTQNWLLIRSDDCSRRFNSTKSSEVPAAQARKHSFDPGAVESDWD